MRHQQGGSESVIAKTQTQEVNKVCLTLCAAVKFLLLAGERKVKPTKADAGVGLIGSHGSGELPTVP